MIVEVSGGQHLTWNLKLPQIYIEYLAVNPDNRSTLRQPRKVLGCGAAMLATAVHESVERGWSGRVGLHSLPGAVGFYNRQGFKNLGNDPSEEGCTYMELAGILQGTDMGFEKKLNDWYKRGLELEMQGFDPGIIGSQARLERRKARLRRAHLYRDLVVRAGKSGLKLAIIRTPELGEEHIKLGLMVELHLEGDGHKLSNKAGPAFEALVKDAVADLLNSKRRSRRAGSA